MGAQGRPRASHPLSGRQVLLPGRTLSISVKFTSSQEVTFTLQPGSNSSDLHALARASCVSPRIPAP